MPSCALERWVEVILSALIVSAQAGFTALAPRLEIGAIEIDEGELARDEESGPDGEQEPHAQHDVLHHASPPVVVGAGRWGDRL